MYRLIFIVSSLIALINGQSLPMALCYRNDPDFNECFLNLLNNIKPFIYNGLSIIGLPPLDPFVVPYLNVTHVSATSNFNVIYKPFVFYNLMSYQVNKFQWKGNTIRTQLTVGKTDARSFYKINGTLWDVPVDGGGLLDGKADGINANIKIVKDHVKRDGVDHCKVMQVKIKLKLANPYLHIRSTRRVKSGMTTEVLNSNPQKLEELVSDVLARIFEALFKKYLGILCDTVPFDLLIPMRLNQV